MIKNTLLFSFLLCLISCGPANVNPDKSNIATEVVKANTDNATSAKEGDPSTFKKLSKDSFLVWKQRWADSSMVFLAKHKMEYFEFPYIDFKTYVDSFTSNPKVYLGLEQPTFVDLEIGKFEPHLMIIGEKGGAIDYNLILDYTRICPPKCNN